MFHLWQKDGHQRDSKRARLGGGAEIQNPEISASKFLKLTLVKIRPNFVALFRIWHSYDTSTSTKQMKGNLVKER